MVQLNNLWAVLAIATTSFSGVTARAVVARQDDKVEVKILPLGASIMSGVGSEKHSGLRKYLRQQLRWDEWPVNMVGTKDDGDDMADNDHEATSGFVLTEIHDALKESLGYKPNVVIINGGTNNANQDKDVDQAYNQMEEIINEIWGAADMADTCVILSTLLVTSHETGAANRGTINDQYRDLVRNYKDDKCIYLADMEPEGEGQSFISLDDDIWSDDPKIHPNDEGHKRMAYVFYAALRRALDGGRVGEPAPIDGPLKDAPPNDDEEGVIDPELPEQPGNPIGGPGPGDL